MQRRDFLEYSIKTSLSLSSIGYLGSQLTGCSQLGTNDYQSIKHYSQTGRFSHEFLNNMAKKYGTPLYIYDADLITKQYQEFQNGFKKHYPKLKVHYAVKANSNLNIIKHLGQLGSGAECISMNEVKMAIKMGVKPRDVIFTSNSKTLEELKYSVQKNILINLDSLGDLDNLAKVVKNLNKKARVSFRINPDVDSKTHRFISTGHKFSKFGILIENDEYLKAYEIAHKNPLIEVQGIHSHIGSQILELNPFIQNARLVCSMAQRLYQKLGIKLQFINLGGGLGIPYHDGQKGLTPELVAKEVASIINTSFAGLYEKPTLWLEPGRYFVGASGFLLSSVNSVKYTSYKNFINIDTGFNHLVRPTLYQAYHRVRVLNKNNNYQKFEIAGNICETGDIMGSKRILPTPNRGDIVAFLDAGAYGFSMSSEYNSFHLPAEVLIKGNKDYLVRKRSNLKDLLRNQVII
jgi:diaminopimelate decarboxylase